MGTDDPTDVVAHEEREAQLQEQNKERKRQDIEDLKWLMSDKRGRRFIWRVLGLSRMFHNPFTGNRTTDFNCGLMLIGQTLYAEINTHCPEKLEPMTKENSK